MTCYLLILSRRLFWKDKQYWKELISSLSLEQLNGQSLHLMYFLVHLCLLVQIKNQPLSRTGCGKDVRHFELEFVSAVSSLWLSTHDFVSQSTSIIIWYWRSSIWCLLSVLYPLHRQFNMELVMSLKFFLVKILLQWMLSFNVVIWILNLSSL